MGTKLTDKQEALIKAADQVLDEAVKWYLDTYGIDSILDGLDVDDANLAMAVRKLIRLGYGAIELRPASLAFADGAEGA